MSEDLIRRSDAIEAIEVVDWYHQNRNKDMVSGANSSEHQAWYKADDIYKALEAIPTIEPKAKVIAQVTFDEEKMREIVKEAVGRFKEEYEIEPKRGEWINKIVDDVKITVCSNCNKEPTFTHYYGSCGNYSLSDFCPNCGARMKGADDELVQRQGKF